MVRTLGSVFEPHSAWKIRSIMHKPRAKFVRTLSDLSKVFQILKRLCCSGDPTKQHSIRHFLVALRGLMVPDGPSRGPPHWTNARMGRFSGCTVSRRVPIADREDPVRIERIHQ